MDKAGVARFAAFSSLFSAKIYMPKYSSCATPKSVLHRIIPLPLLAKYVATVPTTSVGRGIELPRKEFSGHRASPNKNSFGK